MFVLLLSVLVGISLLEVIFRMFVFPDWRIVSRVHFETHPIYTTFQKPNLEIRRYNPPNYDVFNRTNSRGFRDREVGFELDLKNLWISGMSNSYGGFVEDEETYAHLLQTKYGYRNALIASEGHVLPNQVAVMRHLHHQGFRPSMVILELTLNNVLRDYSDGVEELKKKFFVSNSVSLETRPERALDNLARRLKALWQRLFSINFIGVKLRLINNSAIYSWAKVGVNEIPFLRKYTLETGLRADPALSDNVPLSLLSTASSQSRDELVQELANYTALIAEWTEKTTGGDFGVLLIPSKHHINEAWFERYLAAKKYNSNDLDAAAPYKALAAALNDRGVPVLDIAKVFTDSGLFLTFPDDGHINATGHKIIAQELAFWLKTRFGRSN